MTPEEAIVIIYEKHMDCEDYLLRFGEYPDGYNSAIDQAMLIAAKALEEIQQYREIGTVEQVRNQKENLNVAYRIISDYEAIGTVEECREAITGISTAFDKEKVISDLEFLRKDSIQHGKQDFADAYGLAIEVVKKGGME